MVRPITEEDLMMLAPKTYELLAVKIALAKPTKKIEQGLFEVVYFTNLEPREVAVSSVKISRCWAHPENFKELLALKEWVVKQQKVEEYPPYVKLGKIGLRKLLGTKVYYRDVGHWSVTAESRGGKLIVARNTKGVMAHTAGQELVACSKREWEKDNAGYVWSASRMSVHADS